MTLACAALCACEGGPRNRGLFSDAEDLVARARSGDADATQAIVLRGQALPFLSSPYQTGSTTALQDGDYDGLQVQPAFSDTHAAAFVTTEQWREFPKVWAQPMYLLVTGFDANGSPQALQGALPVFSVGPKSRFYSPYWQVQYVIVPATQQADALRSSEQIVNSGLPMVTGALRLCSLVPAGLEVARPAGQSPTHPFTGDPLKIRLPGRAWLDGEQISFLDFGANRFRVINDALVVQETVLYRLAIRGPDGQPRELGVPPIVGTGPLRAPRASDAPGDVPQFGALMHEYQVVIPTKVGGTLPGVFVPASRPELRAKVIAQLGEQFVPTPSIAAEKLAEKDQYVLRVALDGACLTGTDFPLGCTWLDSQQQIENNLPFSSFFDQKTLWGGSFVFFNGEAL